MARLGDLFVRLRADDKQARKDIKGFRGFIQRETKTIDRAFRSLAIGVGVVSAALIPVFRRFADWEFTMRNVQAITGATGEQFEKLEEQSKSLGRTTVRTASEVAQAQNQLALAGFSVNEILEATPSVVNAAIIAQLDMAEAARLSANLLRGFGEEASNLPALIDLLVVSQSSANQTFRQSAEALAIAQTGNAQLGDSASTLAAFTSVLADLGRAGQEGGTEIRNLYLRILEVEEGLKEFGITLFDSEGEFVGMINVVQQVENAMRGMNTEQQFALTNLIGGTRLRATWNSILNQGSERLVDLKDKFDEANGATGNFIAILEQSLKVQLDLLASSFEGLNLAIAEALRELAEEGIDRLTEFINWLTKLVEQNEKVIAGFASTTAKVVGLTGAVLLLIKSLQGLFKLIASRWGIIGIALALIWEFNVALGNMVGGLDGVKAGWQRLMTTLKPVFEIFRKIYDILEKIGRTMDNLGISGALGFFISQAGRLGSAIMGGGRSQRQLDEETSRLRGSGQLGENETLEDYYNNQFVGPVTRWSADRLYGHLWDNETSAGSNNNTLGSIGGGGLFDGDTGESLFGLNNGIWTLPPSSNSTMGPFNNTLFDELSNFFTGNYSRRPGRQPNYDWFESGNGSSIFNHYGNEPLFDMPEGKYQWQSPEEQFDGKYQWQRPEEQFDGKYQWNNDGGAFNGKYQWRNNPITIPINIDGRNLTNIIIEQLNDGGVRVTQ